MIDRQSTVKFDWSDKFFSRGEKYISSHQASQQLGYFDHQRGGGYPDTSGLPGQRLSTASLASSTPSYQSSSTSRWIFCIAAKCFYHASSPGWARVCHLLLQHLLPLLAAPTLPPQGPAMLASLHLTLVVSHSHLQLDLRHLTGRHLQILSRQDRFLPGLRSLHLHPLLLPPHQRDLQLGTMFPQCFPLLLSPPHHPLYPVATPLTLGQLPQETGPTLKTTRAAARPESQTLSSPLPRTRGSQRTQNPFPNHLDMGGPSPMATLLLKEKMRCWHKLWALTRWVSQVFVGNV